MIVKSMMVRVGADTKDLDQAMKGARSKVKDFGASMKKVGAGMTVAGGAITGAVGLMMKGFVKAGDEVHKMALRTGISTEALSELKYAAELSGASLGSLEKGVKKMSMSIYDGTRESKEYVDAFKMIGLSAEELVALSPEEQFMKIADGLAGMENESNRAAIAQKLLGRAGTDLLPLFAAGAEGMEAMRQEARDLGLSIGGPSAAAAAKLGDAMTTLKGSFQGVTMSLAANLAPTITLIVGKITEVVQKVKGWMEEHPKLAGLIIKVVVAVGALAMVLGPLLILLPGIAAGMNLVSGSAALMAAKAKILAVVNRILGTSFTTMLGPISLIIAAIAVLAAGVYLVIKNWDKIKAFFTELWATVMETFTVALTWLKEIIFTSWELIKGTFLAAFEWTKELVFTSWETIKETFLGVFNWIKELVFEHWEFMKKTFLLGFNFIKDKLSEFAETFKKIFTAFKDFVTKTAGNMVQAVIDKFLGMFNKVKEVMTNLKNKVTGIFTSLKEKIVGHSLVPDMCSAIIGSVKDMREATGAEFSRLTKEGKDAIDDLSKAADVGFGNVADYVEDMKTASSGAFKDMATSLKDSARSIMKTLENKAIGYAITKVMAAVPFPFNLVAVAGAIATIKTLFSKIKLFKEGGIAYKPTLAVVGEKGPEVITPLSKIGAGMGGGTTITQKNYFYGSISNVGDLDEISKRLAQRTRRAIERGRR